MKNVLVLTDLSGNSVNAYQYAVQLACEIKADIILAFGTNGQQISLTNQLQFSQKLHSFAKRYACASRLKDNPHHTECLITAAFWAEAVPALVQQYEPVLVVASSELLTQLQQEETPFALQVIKDCPMLWVPARASYQSVKNVVFITDFTDQDADTLAQVKELSTIFSASISCVHFYAKTDRNRLAEIKKQGTGLQTFLKNAAAKFYLIEEEDLVEGLEDFAQKHPVDLFVFATRDTHLAHHYFQPVYRKTNSCQTAIPVINLYQLKKKSCAANCIFCAHTAEEFAHS